MLEQLLECARMAVACADRCRMHSTCMHMRQVAC
jgi:hypothetical protein